jgi:TonB family protein
MEPLAPPAATPPATTLEATPPSKGPKLTLLSKFDRAPEERKRVVTAAELSVAAHVVVLVLLLVIHIPSPPLPEYKEEIFKKHLTPLYIPPELTQKAPNKTEPKKELVLESIAAKPVLKAPSPSAAAAVKQGSPVKQMPLPTPTTQPTAQKPVIAEAPKLEATPPNPQPVQIAPPQPLPPPPGSGPPKIAFEDVAPKPAGARPTGAITMPSTSVDSALRALTRGGGAGSSSVGDTISDEGSGPGLNLPPSAGRPQSSLQLKSDPMGVDFRPYMIQVLAAVRRNWFAVYPEAAKTGMRGQVILQFRIDKAGKVVKVGFNSETSSRPLNEAAVAAISASNPMPPLPAAFKGDSVVLQMTFLYNMPK